MSIARQLQRYGTQYIVIAASNVLDQLFLAQFLHRACPDARLMFYMGDLLFEREIDNVPFIGAITFTPYHLIGSEAYLGAGLGRVYSDLTTEAYYNAASFALWNKTDRLKIAGYQRPVETSDKKETPTQPPPPLWVTVIGSDGYYPIGVASSNGSEINQILPPISGEPEPTPPRSPVSPGRLWFFLCVLIFLVCLSHSALLGFADYWSPFTRELAVNENDQPRRRAMNIHIATVMLFCMTRVLAIPLYPTFRFCQFDPGAVFWSRCVLAGGVLAMAVTFWKTWKYIGWRSIPEKLDLNHATEEELAEWLVEEEP